MTDIEKVVLKTATEIIRLESRNFYDKFKHGSDSENDVIKAKALKNFEKYQNLERLARELEIISLGNL